MFGELISAATSLWGAHNEASAAEQAAQQQTEAANRATELQRQMYEQGRSDQEPWRRAGLSALAGLRSADFQRDFTASDFTKDPGYDFRMQEGQKALERSAAARGGSLGGASLRALARYGQDYASNEYGNAYNRFNSDRDRRFNRLSSLAGYGQSANAANAASGAHYADAAGNNWLGAANARGAAGIAGAQAWGNAVQQVGNIPNKMTENVMRAGAMLYGGGGGMGGGGGQGGGFGMSGNNTPSYWSKNPYSG